MADIILTPIAELIIETLGSAAVVRIKSVHGASVELSKLEETLKTIRAVLVDAEKQQIREEQVRDWLEKLEAVLLDADDLVDEVNAEGLRRQLMPGKKIRKKVRTFFSSNNQLVFRHKMASEIKTIRERLDAISADKERFHFATIREETQPARRARDDTHSFVIEKNIVGRDKDRSAIVELLLKPENRAHQERVSVIPIVGMGGLGKTTLAQLVFNDERVQQHFDLKIWVCVSNDFSVKVICEKILKIITDEGIEKLEMEQLQIKLREKINEKRYLLVLDDVWSEDGRKWTELKDLLSDNCSKGSRIIVTTRLRTVAHTVSTKQLYDLGILDLEDSWNLFKTMADHEEIELPTQMVDNVKRILAKCAGLPLAVSMIGSMLLSSRNPEIEWPSFLKKELSNMPQEENGILPTLRLSYDYLPSHLKPCFAYCSLFPKDHEFDVQTLIILWGAQGFIRLDERKNPEEISYEYFRDLLWRSFFQEAKKDELNMVKTCKMHDLVHDLAIQVAGEKYVMLASCEEKTLRKSVRHVSLDFNSLSRAQPGEVQSLWLQASRLRSFLHLSRRTRAFEKDSAWDEVISNLKFLRMLDLHDVKMKEVPSSVCKLKHLRYLDLSRNKIKSLPASITQLVNLQTLKLNWCKLLCELPSEIEKLVNLRHLELKGCSRITHMPRGLGQLTNLQTLSHVALGESVRDYPRFKPDELMGLNNLRGKLKIKGIKSGMLTTATELIEKKHLQSLSLEFERSNGNASNSEQEWKITLDGLQPHPNLRVLSLYLYGGSSLSGFLPTLTNLVKLRLERCRKCPQLPSLDQFHSLKKMELRYLAYLEYITVNQCDNYFSTSFSQSVSVLPSLQELTLYELPKFRGWWRSGMTENQVEQLILPSFPRLSSLTIIHCEKLTSMPRYPNIEGKLEFRSTSRKTFEQTSMAEEASSSTTTIPRVSVSSSHALSKLTFLKLDDVTDLEYFPKVGMKGLASLKNLHIWNCHELKYLSRCIQYLTSLEELEIKSCKEFQGIKWPETPALTSLRKLELWRLRKLKHLVSPAIQYLTSLQELSISDCEELQVSNDDSIAWQSLTSLHSLEFEGLPQLVTLPGGLQFLTTLKGLHIMYCDNLTALPDWICMLSSLQSLTIWRCPNIKSVPGSISSLTSLQRLRINGEDPREIQEDLEMS